MGFYIRILLTSVEKKIKVRHTLWGKIKLILFNNLKLKGLTLEDHVEWPEKS